MAGDWIKLQCCTPDKPEVFGIADHLGIEPEHALGGLVKLWIWADQQLRSGYDLNVTKKTLERITGVTGIADAMQKVGWLEVEFGVMSIPNFDRHNGKSAKNRALSKNRMEKKRYADNVTTASPEKRREENKEKKENTKRKKSPEYFLDLIPENLKTEEFITAWQGWVDYRREIKKGLTKASVQRSMPVLATFGITKAIERIEKCIANSYQGLIFNNDGRKNGRPIPASNREAKDSGSKFDGHPAA